MLTQAAPCFTAAFASEVLMAEAMEAPSVLVLLEAELGSWPIGNPSASVEGPADLLMRTVQIL